MAHKAGASFELDKVADTRDQRRIPKATTGPSGRLRSLCCAPNAIAQFGSRSHRSQTTLSLTTEGTRDVSGFEIGKIFSSCNLQCKRVAFDRA